MFRKTGRAAGWPPAGRRLPVPGRRADAVDDVVEVRLEVGEDGRLLRRGDGADRDLRVEAGLRAVVDRRLEPGHRLALRRGDLGERLAALELRAQLGGRQPEVGGRGLGEARAGTVA